MSYPDSVRYLYSLGNEIKVGAKFGLERIRTLLTALGNPERGQRFVHIAGTNGKGSTSAAIAAILQEAGFRTGLYTSPHLQEPTERIQVNGAPVSPEQFAAAFERVHAVAERLLAKGDIDAHPSYFETVTAMAFLFFSESCDRSVIEVGLGGRLDATNVIVPEITVITPISFDHESFLGNTLELIASEKAGILKPNVPAVFATQTPEVLAILEARAAFLKAPIRRTVDALLSNVHCTRTHSAFQLNGETFEFSLAGRHQVNNAATAILACQLLGIETSTMRKALRRVSWPGRLEVVRESPDVILDGAHNPQGAGALAAYIREMYAEQPVWIVYGAMRDKAIEEVTAQLFPLANRLILTAPNVPRALRPEAIAEMTDHPDIVITQTVMEAAALLRTAPTDAVVVFTGSLFVVGEARTILRRPKAERDLFVE